MITKVIRAEDLDGTVPLRGKAKAKVKAGARARLMQIVPRTPGKRKTKMKMRLRKAPQQTILSQKSTKRSPTMRKKKSRRKSLKL